MATNVKMDSHDTSSSLGGGSNVSAEYSMLMHGINTCAAPLVHQIVRQNPQLVHHKG